MHDILRGADDRLLVVIGPVLDPRPAAALDYARRLAERASALRDDLAIVMRVYFEKPRTTVGWKGLINDPHLDGASTSTRASASRGSSCSRSTSSACLRHRVPRPDLARSTSPT